MTTKDVTVLFDEFGTPQIANTDRTDWFLGVSVRYSQAEESGIFRKCEGVFGLTKTNPLKNKQISNCRTIRIAELLGGLPLSIFVSGVNIADPEYREIIIEYVRIGNKAKAIHRPEVRERPIAQIIHSHVLDHCLFHSITGHFEANGGDVHFSVFIDNWSIPNNDVDIYLEYRTALLHRNISQLCTKYHVGRPVSIRRIELHTDDTNRKRFVDVVTSAISRAFLRSDNPKYSRKPIDALQKSGTANFNDATGDSIELMQMMMNSQIRDRNSNYR